MSIGFRLTAKCKNISSFQESLDAVAARNNISASHTEDYSELSLCRLGNIFFNYEPEGDEIVIAGDCQTNLLGAGFHKYATEIACELIRQSELSLRWRMIRSITSTETLSGCVPSISIHG